MSTIDLAAEPRGAAYVALLEFLGPRSVGFSLVWRDAIAFRPGADAVRIRLEPFLLRADRASEWPGARLLDGVATVRHYASVPEALSVLHVASGLFAWQAPALPEDLCFYAPDGRLLFASVAHEGDAWFERDAVSRASISRALPALPLRDGAEH